MINLDSYGQEIDHEPITMDLHIIYRDDDCSLWINTGVTVNKDQVSLLMALPIILWNMVIESESTF